MRHDWHAGHSVVLHVMAQTNGKSSHISSLSLSNLSISTIMSFLSFALCMHSDSGEGVIAMIAACVSIFHMIFTKKDEEGTELYQEESGWFLNF